MRTNKNNNRRKRAKAGPLVNPGATSYSGPIRSLSSESYHTVTLSVTPLQVSTGATGVTTGFVTGADVTTATDWGVVASLWAEYRILGFRTEYVPSVPEGAGVSAIGYVAAVHKDSLALPAGAGDLVNVPGRKYVNFGKRWQCEWRMGVAEEADFILTSSTTNKGGNAFYGQFGPASTVLGYYTTTFLIQFRTQL